MIKAILSIFKPKQDSEVIIPLVVSQQSEFCSIMKGKTMFCTTCTGIVTSNPNQQIICVIKRLILAIFFEIANGFSWQ